MKTWDKKGNRSVYNRSCHTGLIDWKARKHSKREKKHQLIRPPYKIDHSSLDDSVFFSFKLIYKAIAVKFY